MKELDIINLWKNLDYSKFPYVLEADKQYVNNNETSLFYNSYEEYIKNIGKAKENPNKFHLGLLPIPYLGNIRTAKVLILMANPGFGPSDYKAEYGKDNFRESYIDNLRQEVDGDFPFISLNPKYSWHGGFEYWEEKFSDTIDELMLRSGKSYLDILKFIANNVAVLELIPYHSKQGRFISDLPSSKMILDFVHTELVPRARKGEILIVVTRKIKEWGFKEIANENQCENICVYDKTQARSAHLSKNSKGGKRIVNFLFGLM